jgi:hypothetical protein
MMWHVVFAEPEGSRSLALHDHAIPRFRWPANSSASLAMFAE